MGLTKAYLELIESTGSGPPTTTSGGKRVPFQFNPKEIKVEKAADWVTVPVSGNGEAPPPQYIGPKPAEMTVEMFLDASDQEDGDVSKDVQVLFDACAPTESSKSRDRPLPAFVIFGWDKVHFRGYIDKVSATYTLFRENGKPVRATCTIALTEIPKATARQNPTSGGLGAHGSVQIVAGDTLGGIAWREYGDPALWRAIAEANGIDDPLRVPPGARLLVPAAADAARYS